jgi:protein-disulfide isomerase
MHLVRRHLASAVAVAALLTAGVAAAQSTNAAPAAPSDANPSAPPIDPNPPMWEGPEYIMGNPKAKVALVEYASASCPHCARFDVLEFPGLKAKYIDTGKVRYVFREFLTSPEELAAIGFLLARCAGEAKYWTAIDQFFHDQTEIVTTGQVQAVVLRIAKTVGLTEPQVEACIDSKPALDALNARMQTALKAKIEGTPTFLINGVEFHEPGGKEPDLAGLSAAIDPLLAPVHPAPAHRKRRRKAA